MNDNLYSSPHLKSLKINNSLYKISLYTHYLLKYDVASLILDLN